MNRSLKRPIVFAVRDFPPGCGTQTNVSSRLADEAFKNPRTIDVAKRNLSTAAPTPNKAFKNPKTIDVAKRNLSTAAPTPNGTCVEQYPAVQDHVVSASSSSFRKALVIRNSDTDPTPREKVLKELRLFNQVYREFERDKEARRGGLDATSRIDIKTQEVIENMGRQVNVEKRIGSVPGINIGDVFQYKTELRIVGLHSKTMCGIDYMEVGNIRLATSIVASESYGYNNTFSSGVMIYTGQGGNVASKETKTEDQKLVRGNLALANSMKHKNEVRVIRGEERCDHKGKRYVYDGLYIVDECWSEIEARGKIVYKFKLCRIPCQLPLT